jgi:hypothetical protein
LQEIGGELTVGGTTYERMGFSILRLLHIDIDRGTRPVSWTDETARRFARASPEYHIVDMMSLIMLTKVASTYHLERTKKAERSVNLLSQRVKKSSIITGADDSGGSAEKVADLHADMARQRSAFLGDKVDLRNELDTLDDVLKASSEYLLRRDPSSIPREEAFVHPTEATDHVLRMYPQGGSELTGVLSSFLQVSRSTRQELVNTTEQVDEEQSALMSHIDGLLDIGLQRRLEQLTQSLANYTKWLIVLTAVLIFLTVVTVGMTIWASTK